MARHTVPDLSEIVQKYHYEEKDQEGVGEHPSLIQREHARVLNHAWGTCASTHKEMRALLVSFPYWVSIHMRTDSRHIAADQDVDLA